MNPDPCASRLCRTVVVLALSAALSGCSSWNWIRTRFSEEEPLRTADVANAPKPSAYAPTPAPAPTEPPARPAPPSSQRGLGTPPAVAPAAAAPVPAPTPLERVEPAPRAAARPAPQPAPEAPTPALAAGRWAVQVGVFAVAANADKDRARIESRLANSGLAPARRVVRVERIGNRSHVLVGDLPDRAAAQELAAQLRRALKQDVVILRR